MVFWHLKQRLTGLALALAASCGPAETRPDPAPGLAPVVGPAVTYSSVPPAQMEPGPLPKLPPAAPLTLIAGDLLHITVFRQKDLELEVRVPEGGSFAYPLIGDVGATGSTVKLVETDIRKRLEEKYLYRAGVTVTVKEYAPRSVYVMGGVQKPGGYEIHPNRRLTVLQLISTAGGYTDRAQKEYGQLIRRKANDDRELIRFSAAEVERAVARGKVEADIELTPDDLVVIPSAARVVYVLGQVNKPGSFDLPADTRITVSMAVSQAGSWTKFASTGSLLVLRQSPTGDSQKLPVNLDEVLNGKLEQDLELRPGDVVIVPQRALF
ncbi:MAG TPA: polysaccharide biosynthesis/export family protein [Planctomycetota bacterium]|nr:polysaccharide biosynthesis/export family protein [Planctomycetota bacterium]